MHAVPLDRPPRPSAGAVTDAVRGAILAEALRRGLPAPVLLAFHAEADYHAGLRYIVADVEQRYGMPSGSLAWHVARRMFSFEHPSNYQTIIDLEVFADEGAGPILLELPETEFLTVITSALKVAFRNGRIRAQEVADLYKYAGEALRAHGTPYRASGDDWEFEWIGDPTQYELTVQPALQALADPRLAGAQDEFEDALLKRRRGTPKELEAAIGKAASAVESTLKILHHEHNTPLPKSGELGSLFGRLSSNDSGRKALLPGWLEHLVLAPGGPRNNMSSHGQGPTIRVVPEELAEASIAAAATAITLLAHYLP